MVGKLLAQEWEGLQDTSADLKPQLPFHQVLRRSSKIFLIELELDATRQNLDSSIRRG